MSRVEALIQKYLDGNRGRLAVAALIIIIFSLDSFLYQSNQKHSKTNQIIKNKILPGGNKAYLTLADDKKISLTDADIGEIARQAGIKIRKTTGGQLVYTGTPGAGSTERFSAGRQVVLKPDEQAVLTANSLKKELVMRNRPYSGKTESSVSIAKRSGP